jgi:ATP-dependent DNA helicase PIF1
LAIIHEFRSGNNLHIAGEGGAGKSLLLTYMRDEANHNSIPCVVTALSGIAASRLAGHTLHSWAGVGFAEKTFAEYVRIFTSRNHTSVLERWTHPRFVLFIDEVMMCPASLFLLLEQLARRLRNDDRPFGGIQVITFGDAAQLPPVEKGSSSSSGSGPKHLSQLPEFLRTFPPTSWAYLRASFRHKSDPEYAMLLRRARTARLLPEDHKMLASRVNAAPAAGIVPTELCYYREQVERINNEAINRLAGPDILLECTAYSLSVRRSMRPAPMSAEQIPFDTPAIKRLANQMRDDARIRLRLGAEILFTRNRRQEFYNGTRGVLVAVGGAKPTWSEPLNEWIRPAALFADAHVVPASLPDSLITSLQCDRDAKSPVAHRAPVRLWIHIHGKPKTQLLSVEPEAVCAEQTNASYARERPARFFSKAHAVCQYPILPAHAITVHRAQGMELSSVRADLNSKAFSSGQIYTLLSRCTRLDGLCLRGYRPEAWQGQSSAQLTLWEKHMHMCDCARYEAKARIIVQIAKRVRLSMGVRAQGLADMIPLIVKWIGDAWPTLCDVAPPRYWQRVWLSGT